MKIDPSRAIGAYAAVATLAAVWLGLGGGAVPATRFGTIDVERINVREPDGTLRLAIASHARMPGIVVGAAEYPHPDRPEAGMIFYNDEGTENGGLVFDGRLVRGKPTNGGSLTFDRWRQDQTIQFRSSEDGAKREAAVVVNDRPDGPMDFAAVPAILTMSDGPARAAALTKANLGRSERVYLGRTEAGASQLVLRDALGRPRMRLSVAADGGSAIEFLDAAGRLTRRVP